MKRIVHGLIAAGIAGLLIWVANPPSAGTAAERSHEIWSAMPQAVLHITERDGDEHRLAVRVAANGRARAQGMQHLPASVIRETPIWFEFEREQRTGWHMNNVVLALDIIYVDGDGRVIGRERMEPGGSGYGLDRPIAAALEVAAGQAERYGLERGATVERQ